MKKKYPSNLLLFILLFSCCIITWGQSKNQESDYYVWFDEITGVENSNLYEGTVYVEEYPAFNKSSRFFNSLDYLPGQIVYGGETYFNLTMKYDVYGDEVLLGLRNDSKFMMLQILRDKVSSFVIDGHKFVNLYPSENQKNSIAGFHEVLLETSFFTFFKKHKKLKYARHQKSRVFYKFSDKHEYYLNYNNQYYPVKNKKDIIKIFSESGKDIDKHLIKPPKDKDPDTYMTQLLQVMNNHLLSKEKSTLNK